MQVMGGNANLYARIAAVAATRGEAVLLAAPGRAPISYAELDALTGRLAAVLRRLGLAPGDRLAVQVEKSPESLLLYLACLRAGVVYLPLNTAYTLPELDYFIGDAEPGLVLVDPAREAALARRLGGDRAVLGLDAEGRGSFMERIASLGEEVEFDTVPAEDGTLAAICYTSGTTGRAKGAMLTHGNLASNAQTLRESWGFTAQDRLLHALPIYHVHGLFVATNTALLAGASLLFLPRFEAGAVLEALPRASVMMGVPTHYTRLLAEAAFTAEAAAGIRLFISGSAPLLEQTFQAFEQRTGQRILERYGMTETGMNTSNPLHGERRAGTVGLPLPGIEVRLKANGEPGDGKVGELEVKGPNVCAGYWRMPEATAQAFTPDGFFKTGDLGTIGPDGYVRIVGRGKDLIITGGLNVYPKEVELVLDALPGIDETAVIGVPHPDFGEAVVAMAVARADVVLDEEDILALAREQLAGFKLPKRVIMIEALPRNAMGKVQKNVLRERFVGLFS